MRVKKVMVLDCLLPTQTYFKIDHCTSVFFPPKPILKKSLQLFFIWKLVCSHYEILIKHMKVY